MRTDAELQHDVFLAEMQVEPAGNGSEIFFSVEDGVVTLRGSSRSSFGKYAAERAALRVAGVKAVANEIVVRLVMRDGQPTDTEIAKAVVSSLERNARVPNDSIKVTVRKGWVTLEGSVQWLFQRQAAGEIVHHTEGVQELTDLISVEPEVPLAEVKARIEEALEQKALIDVQRVLVKIDGQGVILQGKVGSWAAREEVERVAWSHGVSHVDNEILVTS